MKIRFDEYDEDGVSRCEIRNAIRSTKRKPKTQMSIPVELPPGASLIKVRVELPPDAESTSVISPPFKIQDKQPRSKTRSKSKPKYQNKNVRLTYHAEDRISERTSLSNNKLVDMVRDGTRLTGGNVLLYDSSIDRFIVVILENNAIVTVVKLDSELTQDFIGAKSKYKISDAALLAARRMNYA